MSSNIKDGVLYNGNPDINPAAIPLYTIGNVNVGDTMYSASDKYVVTRTGLSALSEDEDVTFPAIEVVDPLTYHYQILVNGHEDGSGRWD